MLRVHKNGGLSRSMLLREITNQSEFTPNTKYSNTYCACCVDIRLLLLSMWHGVLYSVQFNNFDHTTGFYWSYTLSLKLLILIKSWYAYSTLRVKQKSIHWSITGNFRLFFLFLLQHSGTQRSATIVQTHRLFLWEQSSIYEMTKRQLKSWERSGSHPSHTHRGYRCRKRLVQWST